MNKSFPGYTHFLQIAAGVLLITMSLLLSACYSASIAEDPEIHKEVVDQWLKRTYTNPHDAEALKNLGIFYVQANENIKAKIYLDRALAEIPADPALHFYKGLNLESFNENAEAEKYYYLYTKLEEGDDYKELLEGRYLWLQRQNAYADIKNIISKEDELSGTISSDSAIAVFPLIYRGMKPEYVPLSRGFSEMISIDLGKIPRLSVLERIRVQAVLNELAMAEKSEQSSAPRAGKILKAATIISGDFDIRDEKEFLINLGSWAALTSEQKIWVNKAGDLQDLFTIEKELVFAFLQKSGIDITQEEKESIAYIPTQNLQSFLAYSKGLLFEDSGNYNDAALSFQQALNIDPAFTFAKSKLNSTQNILNGGGEKEKVVQKMEEEDPVTKKVVSNLLFERINSIMNILSSGFHPGDNNRSPAQEKSLYEETTILPEPPNPPGRN